MKIYTNGFVDSSLTPAHEYAAMRNFGDILNLIKIGQIVCGTGNPYPIEWQLDDPAQSAENNNVFNNSNTNSFINPYA